MQSNEEFLNLQKENNTLFMSDVLKENIDLSFSQEIDSDLEKVKFFFDDIFLSAYFISFKKNKKSLIYNIIADREFILFLLSKKITKIEAFDFKIDQIGQCTFSFFKDKNNYIIKIKIKEQQNGI